MVYNSKAWKKAKNPEIRAFLQYIDGQKPENSERVAEFADDIERFKEKNIVEDEFMDYAILKSDMMDKGKAIGAKQALLETAKNLFSMNLSTEQIAQATGLSLAELEALQSA